MNSVKELLLSLNATLKSNLKDKITQLMKNSWKDLSGVNSLIKLQVSK